MFGVLQEDLEFQLAQALFSAGVLFAFVENLLIIQFFQCLWPSFKLPNRRKLADELFPVNSFCMNLWNLCQMGLSAW